MTYKVQILLKKKSYFLLFFLESYFFYKQSKFLDVLFYWNKLWINLRMKIEISLSIIEVKFTGEKKKFVFNKVLLIISYKNFKARASGLLENVNTFCDNLKQAMTQIGKNYPPSNIYNLIVKRSSFICQNKKVQMIQRLPCITKLNK